LKGEFKASCGQLTRLKQCCICEFPAQEKLLSVYTSSADSICTDFKKFMLEENLTELTMPMSLYYTGKGLTYNLQLLKKESVCLGTSHLKNTLWSCVMEIYHKTTNENV
jgi:hypothetical protein